MNFHEDLSLVVYVECCVTNEFALLSRDLNVDLNVNNKSDVDIKCGLIVKCDSKSVDSNYETNYETMRPLGRQRYF